MAKKQRKSEIKRLPTKHQLSKWERQRKMQRNIYIGGAIFVAIVLALVGCGYYFSQVEPFQQKVLRVNDTVIDMNYYLELLGNYLQGVDSAQAPYTAEMVLGSIMQNELVIQRAPKLGITVEESEVDSELAKLNLPNDRVHRDAYKANLLSNRLISEYIEPKVPTTAKQVWVQAMFVESEDVANEVIGRLNNGESFIKLAKEYSIEQSTKEKSGELGWLLEGLIGPTGEKFSNSLLGDIAFNTTPGTVSKPTYDSSVLKNGGYWLLEVTERDESQSSHIRGVLLGTEKEAMDVRTKLQGGADFAELAKEISQHADSKDFGGDLGWIQKGQEYGDAVVIKAAFDLPVGVLSDPIHDETVSTKGGYWLVKVLEKDDNREVDKVTRDELTKKAFQDWMEEQSNTSTIERYLDEKQREWAIAYVLKKQGAQAK